MTEEQVKQLNKSQEKFIRNARQAGRSFGENAGNPYDPSRKALAEQMRNDKLVNQVIGRNRAITIAKQRAAAAKAAPPAAPAAPAAAKNTGKFVKFLGKIPKKGWIGAAVLVATGLAVAGYNYFKKDSEANEKAPELTPGESPTQITTITPPGTKIPDIVIPYRSGYDPNNEEQSEDESEDESAAGAVASQVPNVVTVQNGETVSSIAKKYNVSAEKIRELNADKIKIFQRLKGTCQTESFVVGTEIKLSEDT
jgi:LysM repeat protein